MRHNLNLKLWGVDRMIVEQTNTESVTQVTQTDYSDIINQVQTNAGNVQTALNEAKTIADKLESHATNLDTHEVIKQLKADIETLQQKDLKIDQDMAEFNADSNIDQIQYQNFVKRMEQVRLKCLEVEEKLPNILLDIDFVKNKSSDTDTKLQEEIEKLSAQFNLIKGNINTLKSQKTPEEYLKEQQILTNELVPNSKFAELKEQIEAKFLNILSQIDIIKAKSEQQTLTNDLIPQDDFAELKQQVTSLESKFESAIQDQRIRTNELVPLTSFNAILAEVEILKTSLKNLQLDPDLEELKADLEDLEKQVADLESNQEIEDLKSDLEALETKVASMESNPELLAQIETRFLNVLSEIDSIKNKCAETEEILSNKASFSDEIEQLKSDMEELETKVTNLVVNQEDSLNVAEIEQSLVDLETTLKTNVENLSTSQEDLKTEQDKLKPQLTTLKSNVESVKDIANNAKLQTEENLRQIGQSLQRIDAIYSDVQNTMTDMHHEVDGNKVKIGNLESQFNTLKTQSGNTEKLEALESKIAENSTNATNLNMKLNSLNSKVGTVADRLNDEADKHMLLIMTNKDSNDANKTKLQELETLKPLIEANRRNIQSHRTIIQLIGEKEDYEADKPVKFNTGLDYYQFGTGCILEKVVLHRSTELTYTLEKWDDGNQSNKKEIAQGIDKTNTGLDMVMEAYSAEEPMRLGQCIAFVPQVNLPFTRASIPLYIELYISL